MEQIKIGKFIAELRKNKNMTQEQLGERLGVSFKTISKWENGRGMPELSTLKPLSEELGVSINEILSGEKIEKEVYQEKLEENIVNTIDYANKKMEKQRNLLSILFTGLGILLSFTAMTIFPSESSWGSIYATFGIIISVIGISLFTGSMKWYKKILVNIGYIILSLIVLLIIDYIGVVNIHQAPRFSLVKVTGDNIIYYDTPFYDVIRYNVNKENETFKIIKNQKYDVDNINKYCK